MRKLMIRWSRQLAPNKVFKESLRHSDNIKMRKSWFLVGIGLMTILCGCKNRMEITGVVYDEEDGGPLFQALITDSRSGETVVTDKDGRYSISVEEGDSVTISYVGMLSKTIAVNPNDSIHWNVALKEYGPIIEPALQQSHSTYEGVSMFVQNLNDLAIPIDSIVLIVKNETDETVMFGEDYELQQKRDAKWQRMPYNRKYKEGECIQVFTAVGYLCAPHSERTSINNTTVYSEKFEKGFYRMTKTFFVGDSHSSDTIYVDFEIL